MNVLSLFDGISCGQLALQRAGIQYDKYYASEINKYAIAVTKYNFPNTIFLSDVREINGKDFGGIDLLIGGSPCQSFSVAGERTGFNGISGLVGEYIRILKEAKPKWFLLENVRMKKEWRDKISKEIGVEPIEINSALVSAQQRKRLYWTNIPVKGLPQDKHIYLKDIIETGFTEREKAYCLTETYGNACAKDYFLKHSRQLIFNKPVRVGTIGKGGQGERIYSIDGKSVSLSANGGGRGAKTGLYLIKDYVRKLMPIECERLQTIPDNYTAYGDFNSEIKKISDSQRYKMIGNAWTVDVVAWIFSFIKGGKDGNTHEKEK